MCAVDLMGNMNRISNSEFALTQQIPNAALGNATTAASGKMPVFAAHQAENDLIRQKLLAEFTYMASNAMEPGLEKMAKERAKSFAVKV
ncbi:MAG: hypothetical protein A2Y25_02525 [Candidatus Melainabacteria bacterium GWF2_37_15]|nr:MAG: hypothetical protein A2Y25_02525 [Candidatus Melainabacteria bacterium GWF2_37_15]